eukprot:Nitzschia sp. Nitz4//scaffold11_size288233//121472//124297//NITZ4_000769-RA/size288233-processed-gene-0.161-mRNA-1//1//CDS//3329534059//7137//frame0
MDNTDNPTSWAPTTSSPETLEATVVVETLANNGIPTLPLPTLQETATISNDNDDDNWSRQVETDDINPGPSSVLGEGEADLSENAPSSLLSPLPHASPEGVAPPQRPEPTLKEKLVERERQRRVETERARLKRQFALQSNGSLTEEADEDEPNILSRENGSVAGTVGEGSIVAPVDVLLEDDTPQGMSYPMERFLQEQGTILEEESPREPPLSTRRDSQNQGVLMERFLQESIAAVEASVESTPHRSAVDRSVSFEAPQLSQTMDIPDPDDQMDDTDIPPHTRDGSMPETPLETLTDVSVDVVASVGGVSLANASMDCVTSDLPPLADVAPDEAPDDNESMQPIEELPPPPTTPIQDDAALNESPTLSQPRVLGLTREEIEEMAAIEEVSQQNAPPSDRDDLSAISFVGELVSDMGGTSAFGDPAAGFTSQGTPTTAVESVSVLSGTQSVQPTVSDHADDHHSTIGSVSSNLVANSSADGGVSVTANPPSELGQEDAPMSPLADIPTTPILQSNPPLELPDELVTSQSVPTLHTDHGPPDELVAMSTDNAGIVNRQIRPGMVSRELLLQAPRITASPVRRTMSVPNKLDFELDGFDFDKHAPPSPHANDMWSPGSRMSFERSPFPPRKSPELSAVDNLPTLTNYRATDDDGVDGTGIKPRVLSPRYESGKDDVNETEPLMPDIPSEIVANHRSSRMSQLLTPGSLKIESLRTMVDEVFSDIRSESSADEYAGKNDAKAYRDSTIFERAIPERMVALSVTLLVEIPVLLMVAGGSDRLCALVGRIRYQLLMGFLPLSSAISGNVGLQASTLTTRAISHGHVDKMNYGKWLVKEMGTALYLGMGMGLLLGCIAFVMSRWSISFGITVMIAQFVSILTAGVTGTLAPLLFTFIFERDAGKWGGPLETAIQDIVGSFAMVILSYKILEFFGPLPVDESDVCGVTN